MKTSHCQKTDWKNRAQEPDDRSGQRHLKPQPKQANCVSMQIENNPSKRDSRDFEKAQSVINRGTQTSYTAFINKINSPIGITERKEQANLNLKIPTSRHIRDCIEGQPMDDP